MKPDLKYFKTEDFHTALQIFFENLNIPVNYLSEEPVHPRDILEETYKKAHDAFELMDDVYFLGMVDDAAFEGAKSLSSGKIESDYDGILIFGVTLHSRKNGLLPARSQLAEISRSFNREFHYTPVIVIFRYDNFIAFANTERLTYKHKSAKQASVKGLINILNSYKFTIAENTPIEEDVALDPELLGKVFENLLASYNLETKTTARKQTGSFYTPREIVNYMVDESLIAHFKNSVSAWDMEEDDLDENLHRLVSYDYPANPFGNDNSLSKEIVHSLDNCKILDPACGSGHSPWECSRKWCISSRKLTLKMSIGRICSLKRQKRRLRGLLPSWTKNREKIACLK